MAELYTESCGCGSKPMGSHFGVGAPPILVPILVGIGMFTGVTIFLLIHGHTTEFPACVQGEPACASGHHPLNEGMTKEKWERVCHSSKEMDEGPLSCVFIRHEAHGQRYAILGPE